MTNLKAPDAETRIQTFPLLSEYFPDMPLDSLPSIPQSWKDTSWRYEPYPSFEAYKRIDGACISVGIDFPNPSDREHKGKRFLAMWVDDKVDSSAQFNSFIETDDWSQLLAAVASEIAQCAPNSAGTTAVE